VFVRDCGSAGKLSCVLDCGRVEYGCIILCFLLWDCGSIVLCFRVCECRWVVLCFLGENKIKIMEELSRENLIENLESDCENSLDLMKRQVAFCARWSLDNLCELFCSLCPVNLCFIDILC